MGRPAKKPTGRGRGRPRKVPKIEKDEKAEPVKSEPEVQGPEKSEKFEKEEPKRLEKSTGLQKKEAENSKIPLKQKKIGNAGKVTKPRVARVTRDVKTPTRVSTRVKKTEQVRGTGIKKIQRVARVKKAEQNPKTEKVKVTRVKKSERVPISKKVKEESTEKSEQSESDSSDHSDEHSVQPSWQRISSSYRSFGPSFCKPWETPEERPNNDPTPLLRCIQNKCGEDEDLVLIEVKIDDDCRMVRTQSNGMRPSSISGENQNDVFISKFLDEKEAARAAAAADADDSVFVELEDLEPEYARRWADNDIFGGI